MVNKLGLIFLLFMAFLLGIFLRNPFQQALSRHDVLPTNKNCPYHFINQLRCEPDLAPKKSEYTVVRNDLLSYIDDERRKGNISEVSVYFRDLENGPTLNIDAQDNFAPASLLKVPLMITYYKKAESHPEVLNRKIMITNDVNSLSQNIQPENRLEVGKEYTVEELIEQMITESDNIVWQILLNDLRKNYSEEDFVITLSDLGIIDPRKRKQEQYITVQSYASIFRILYNSSYLNFAMSNKALELLSYTHFTKGLVAGVPKETLIAHKFGEQLQGDEQQLHDCGIVYYPPNPYLLCVMTKGHILTKQEEIISHISEIMYKAMLES